LGLIKRLLAQRNDFKVIVTSASMDIELFTKYFYKMPHKKVSGTLYPV
jgi:HrpA-like RNA helicase